MCRPEILGLITGEALDFRRRGEPDGDAQAWPDVLLGHAKLRRESWTSRS